METNKTNIPSPVFDWMGKADFESLPAAQQNEVLMHFTEAEYNELHETIAHIKAVRKPERSSGKERIKADLLQKFDSVHQKKKPAFTTILSRPVAVWKAAAILFLVGSGWLSYAVINSTKSTSSGIVSSIDTVYITKEVPAEPLKIHDTVYLEKERRKKREYRPDMAASNTGSEMSYPENSLNDGLNILSVSEMNTKPNRQKRNSMKDDSLTGKFAVVAM